MKYALSLLEMSIEYLRRHGEEVEYTGLGLLQVNGEVCTERDIIDYADDLRQAEGYPSFSVKYGGVS